MLPPIRYLESGPALPQASATAAAAPGQALAQLGTTIAAVGQRGFEIAGRIRRLDEAGKTAKFFSELDREASQFSTQLLTRTDPAQWPEEWGNLTEQFRERASGLDLSPEARAGLELELQSWSTRRTIAFEGQSAQRLVAEARDSITGGLSHAIARGDDEAIDRYVRMMPGAGFMPSEIEEAQRTAARGLAAWDLQRDAEQDPAGTIERLSDPDFLSQPGNEALTIADRNAGLAAAKSELRAITGRLTDDALDRIVENKFSTPDEIDHWYPQLRPAARAQLKRALLEQQSDAYQAELAKPEVQARLAGELAAGLAAWRPELADYDGELVRLSTILSQLRKGPIADQFKDRLDAIKSNAQARAKTTLDLGRDALQGAFEAGDFGPPTITAIRDKAPTLGRLLDDGWLHDIERLQDFGFSLEQAEAIREADRDKDSKTNSLDTFRTLYVQKENDLDPNAIGPWDRSVFEAIRDHAGPTTPIPSPHASEALAASRQKYGSALLRYEDWAAANPNPTHAQVTEFATELGVSNAADHLAPAILRPRPMPPTPQTPPSGLPAPTPRPPDAQGGAAAVPGPTSYRAIPEHSTSAQRAQIAKQGGVSILLDSNSNGKQGGITSPLVVIPDNASPATRAAAQRYLEGMVALHGRLGRTLKPRLVTRSENKRGRSNAIHTEGFAITDEAMVDFLETPAGAAEYAALLRDTLGTIPGATFFLPHQPGDPGAVNTRRRLSEVALASKLMPYLAPPPA